MIRHLFFLAIAVSSTFCAMGQRSDAILGTWANASGEDHILIFKQDRKYFGKLVWIRHPNDEQGKPKTDKKNPDLSQRMRPDLGLVLLKDFVYETDGEYTGGTAYDPKSGKTYSGKMSMNGNVLNLRGYIGISLFGRTEKWTRVK